MQLKTNFKWRNFSMLSTTELQKWQMNTLIVKPLSIQKINSSTLAFYLIENFPFLTKFLICIKIWWMTSAIHQILMHMKKKKLSLSQTLRFWKNNCIVDNPFKCWFKSLSIKFNNLGILCAFTPGFWCTLKWHSF